MKKPLRIQLLEVLEQNKVGSAVNITGFIKRHFKCHVDDSDYKNKFASITIFLSELTDKNWIAENIEDQGIWSQFEHDGVLIPEWESTLNDENALFYYITTSGSEYLNKYYRNNKSWWQRTPTWVKALTAIVTIVSGIIAIYQFIISKYNETPSKKPQLKTEKKRSGQ